MPAYTPELRLGCAHETLGNGRTLTVTTLSGAAFVTAGVKPSRDMLSAGIGVSAQTGSALSLYANYDALIRTGNTSDQTVQAGLRWKF